jgi:cytochrome P450
VIDNPPDQFILHWPASGQANLGNDMADSHSAVLRHGPVHNANPRQGPRGLPFLGNLLSFGRDQLGFFTETARTYGDIVPLNFAGWPSLLVSDMDAIEKILVKDHEHYIKTTLIFRHVTALFGTGLLTSEGRFWQRQRRLAAPAFAGRQLLSYDGDMVALTAGMLDRWRNGQIMDVHPEMMALTLRIAAKTLFNSEVEQDIADIDHAVNDLVVELASRFKRPFLIPDYVPLPGHLRYRRAIRTVERVVFRMIAERRANGVEGRNDFLSRLMAARDDDGNPMSDSQLRDEALTLLLAGHETTALTLSWSLYLLGQSRDADQRLAEEIEEVVGARPVTAADLPALKYTESVLLEAMRLYPPAWVVGRETTRTVELGGNSYPAGTSVFISPWVLHRDGRHFANPEAFMPERWLGNLARELPRFAYMAFGGGPRICIGQRFAMIEAMLILATMVQRFAAEWQADHKVTPFPSITLRPSGGVWLKIRERRPAASDF